MIEAGTHTLPDGRAVEVVEIAGAGLRARVATLGAALLSLDVPDAAGRVADVVLGHAALADYVGDPAYLGVAIGRAAGRIRNAVVEIDGETHRLDANDGLNTLHSGPRGLHAQVWTVEAADPEAVTLAVRSPDGAGGFPGALDVRLRYALTGAAHGGALRLDWEARATAPTPVALTHHAYWNLGGHGAGSVLDHTADVPAERVVALAPDLTPTGETEPVAGTPLDLRSPIRLGDVVGADHALARETGGLDHDLLVGPLGERRVPFRRVARIEAPWRAMEVWSTEPSVHLYAGGFLDVVSGKEGARYGAHAGLAVETQPPPDAAAHDAFPDVVLRPGELFRSRTEYRFGRPRGASG